MSVERDDWGPPTSGPGGRETPGNAGTALVPATDPQQGSETASFSVEDLSLVSPLDALDADDDAKYRQLLREGIYTPDELARHYNLSAEEIEALTKPLPKPASRASVETELAAIEKRMRDDRRGYFKDEAAQARHRELISLQEKLKAQPAPTKNDLVNSDDLSRREIDTELAEIDKLRKEDKRKYWSDDVQKRQLELLAAREEATEHARQAEQAQTTVGAILDAVPDAEAFEASFTSVFTSMPEQAQAAIRQELALPPQSPTRPASEANVRRFASTPEGSELVAAWGRSAGMKVATIRARVERMMSGGDVDAVARWVDGLSAADAKAMWMALAGGR